MITASTISEFALLYGIDGSADVTNSSTTISYAPQTKALDLLKRGLPESVSAPAAAT